MNRIKELRQARRLTQVELARLSGVDQQTISALETGRAKNPSLLIGLQLARALEVEPEELVSTNPKGSVPTGLTEAVA